MTSGHHSYRSWGSPHPSLCDRRNASHSRLSKNRAQNAPSNSAHCSARKSRAPSGQLCGAEGKSGSRRRSPRSAHLPPRPVTPSTAPAQGAQESPSPAASEPPEVESAPQTPGLPCAPLHGALGCGGQGQSPGGRARKGLPRSPAVDWQEDPKLGQPSSPWPEAGIPVGTSAGRGWGSWCPRPRPVGFTSVRQERWLRAGPTQLAPPSLLRDQSTGRTRTETQRPRPRAGAPCRPQLLRGSPVGAARVLRNNPYTGTEAPHYPFCTPPSPLTLPECSAHSKHLINRSKWGTSTLGKEATGIGNWLKTVY
ncbi:vegetative cell wall protein gp1-like [Piliocolobus tephrosceles]|uniref:vegetative cell wall protein gp1-like n=1 Tax=Piliocolobus tephrosceles TaxID=591936 RepID=UPI001301310D|nr:vegetative cell wall protein gp1-like [Piliocolobus tephrosceles]